MMSRSDRLMHCTVANQYNSGGHLAFLQINLLGKHTYTDIFEYMQRLVSLCIITV
jgi:hypothetical protein